MLAKGFAPIQLVSWSGKLISSGTSERLPIPTLYFEPGQNTITKNYNCLSYKTRPSNMQTPVKDTRYQNVSGINSFP